MSGERVAIRPVPGKGLGVFARVAMPAGTLLDTAPAFERDPQDVALIERTCFRHHYFAHPQRQGHGVIVLGAVTLCNRDPRPTLALEWSCDPATGWSVTARTLRDLEAGTELTIDYECELWFEPTP